MKGTKLIVALSFALTSHASAQYMSDGDMDGLSPGTNPDIGVPAGAWQFPDNYVSAAVAEFAPDNMSIVTTSSFDAGASGNSLHMRISSGTANVHLPNLFKQRIDEAPGDIVTVSFDLWVAGAAGGSVYVGGDHGGGGFDLGLDRGPQLSWNPDGRLTSRNSSAVDTVLAASYPRGEWQSVRLEINLEGDTFDAFWGPRGGTLAQVGDDLGYRSLAQDHLDRFTFVHFGGTTPDTDSYIDNIVVIPAPAAVAALVLAAPLRRRR